MDSNHRPADYEIFPRERYSQISWEFCLLASTRITSLTASWVSNGCQILRP
jgi:hypothetical protein